MGEVKLKSKLISGCDYRSIDISAYAIPLEADKTRLERDLINFCKPFAKKEEVNEVANQDMVTLSCSSENPKFQKNHLTLRVGLGLYSKELETKLTGMRCGEQKTVTVGQDTVTISIEKIVREILPELTDALAIQSGLPDVRTVEDIYTYCRFKQYDDLLEEPADEAFAYLSGRVVENTEFELDEEELERSKAFMVHSLNLHSQLEGKSFDAITDEECISSFGISKKELVDNMKLTGEYTLKAAVLGQEMHTFTKEDYEAFLNKRATAIRCPVEDIREENPLERYLIESYSDIYLNTIEQYVFYKLKEIGEEKAHTIIS